MKWIKYDRPGVIKNFINIKPVTSCLFSRRNGHTGIRFLGLSMLLRVNYWELRKS